MEKTEIIIWGIKILEPVTTLTDVIISLVCFFAYIKIRQMGIRTLTYKFFYNFFLLMGIATAIGGLIGHGFLYVFEFKGTFPDWATGAILEWMQKAAQIGWKLPGWLVSMISIWLLERASIEYSKQILNKKVIKLMKIANLVELATFMFLAFYFLNFRFVEIHSGFGLLAVNLPIHIWVYSKTKSKASRIMIWAIAASTLSAIAFKGEIIIHTWFNHFDLSHTLMAISAYIFYRAAPFLKLTDKQIELYKSKVH